LWCNGNNIVRATAKHHSIPSNAVTFENIPKHSIIEMFFLIGLGELVATATKEADQIPQSDRREQYCVPAIWRWTLFCLRARQIGPVPGNRSHASDAKAHYYPWRLLAPEDPLHATRLAAIDAVL
jgi:hypothetical protein